MLNPVTMPMEVYRYALLGQGTISALYLLISVLFTFVVLIFGIMVFNKVERTFMDTV
jgi:lipopolysaccharide transport system permease protein